MVTDAMIRLLTDLAAGGYLDTGAGGALWLYDAAGERRYRVNRVLVRQAREALWLRHSQGVVTITSTGRKALQEASHG